MFIEITHMWLLKVFATVFNMALALSLLGFWVSSKKLDSDDRDGKTGRIALALLPFFGVVIAAIWC